MQITHQGEDIILSPVSDFDLGQTLDCGQSFRWRAGPEGRWEGIARGRRCCLSRDQDRVIFHNTTRREVEKIWMDYFDLTTDYGRIKREISECDVLRAAVACAPGLRLLRQESWEALCSFILSQQNNIGRIKGLVERLCECFGEPLEGGGFCFPTPQRLAALTVEQLAPVRCGFRARYVIDAARKVSAGNVDLAALRSMELAEARQMLMRIDGVGVKVANCALLFGCGRLDCLPEDVWIKRAMRSLFADGFPACAAPWAGIAQQYLYCYVRGCPEVLQRVPGAGDPG